LILHDLIQTPEVAVVIVCISHFPSIEEQQEDNLWCITNEDLDAFPNSDSIPSKLHYLHSNFLSASSTRGIWKELCNAI